MARGILGLAALALVVLALRHLAWRRVLELLRAADLRLLALAVGGGLTLNTFARVRRRALLLAALPRRGAAVGLGELTSALLASFAVNNFLPARAGDVLFAVQFNRQHGYALSSMAAAQLLEKLVEVLSLSLLSPVALLLVRDAPAVLAVPLFVFGGAGALAMVAVSRGLRARRAGVEEPPRPARGIAASLRRWRDAVRGLLTHRTWWPALLWSAAGDVADVGMVWLCARSVGIEADAGTSIVVYLTLNLAIAFPSSPGQVGFLEAGATFALIALGFGENEAVAFALVYHAAHLAPTTLAGAWCLWQLGWQPTDATRPAAVEAAPP